MKENRVLYKLIKVIYSFLLKVLYRPKVIGTDNIPKEGSVIFAGNHRHAFDPVVVMSNTNRIVHFMAKEELFKGLHGILFKKLDIIPVYRSRQDNTSSIVQANNILKSGGTVGIFPEGTRNRTEKDLLNFKTGTIRIAKDTGSMIIPFAIRGKYKILKKGLEIKFGTPINVYNMEIQEANKYLYEQVLKLYKGI